MHPYGSRKIRHNYEDVHPPKGWVNWWEAEFDVYKSKSSERFSIKQAIQQELLEIETEGGDDEVEV